MKLRHLLFLTATIVLLTACNFSLAQDVTPPPDYVPPTPAPTLGPLFPASAPDVADGESIFVEKCLPCHGNTGLGDGEQGKQLSVKVAPIGLADFAQKAKPSDWFVKVTQGNIERFMPPFASLDDQQRWDVVAYAMTLHTTPDQLALGKKLFDAKCTDACADKFRNIKTVSGLSENDIAAMLKKGEGNFGTDLTDTDALAVAMYIRTLTFSAPQAQGEPASATETPVSAEAGTPSAETTPVDSTQAAVTPEATSVAGTGNISGTIDNQTGADLPSELKVTLSAFEHGADPSTGPQEIATFDATVNPDGTFVFKNIEIPENRIFLAKVEVNGQTYQSEYAVVKAGDTAVTLPPIKLFTISSDFSKLTITQTHILVDVKDGTLQIIEFFSIGNSTDTSISIPVVNNQMSIIKTPANMVSVGFDAQQGEALPVQIADGFALPPSDKMYGVAAGFEMPYTKSAEIEIPFVPGIPAGFVLTPIGIKAEGAGFVDKGPTDIGSGNMYQVYEFGEIKPGGVLKVELSGQPEQTPAASGAETKSNQPLLIGVGAFGVVLILAGAWMFMRDRKRANDMDMEVVDENDEAEFDDVEAIMDAIIALDDLHRSGKLSDEAYQQRRTELKNALKRKS